MRHRPLFSAKQMHLSCCVSLHLMRPVKKFWNIIFCCCNRFYGNGKSRRTLFNIWRISNPQEVSLGILKMKIYQDVGTGQNKKMVNGVHSCANAYCLLLLKFWITKHLNLILLIFIRVVLSWEFMVNKHLLHDLVFGLWNETWNKN
jgi:hypothetical protein